MRRFATCVLCVAAATAALIPIPGRAQSCTSFLANLQNLARNQAERPRHLRDCLHHDQQPFRRKICELQ
jgi:hypothetical protein